MPFQFGNQPSANGGQQSTQQQGGGFAFSGGGEKQKSNQPSAVSTPAPEPLPFMALDRDKYGLPYYGPGAQGWARKTFAKIFDPKNVLPKPTEQQAQLIKEAGATGDDVLNDKLGWDKWIGKWTGIKASDAAQVAVGINLAMKGTDESGQPSAFSAGEAIKTVSGAMYRGGGQVISTGLEILGLGDKAMRKVHAFNAALDDIGQSSTILPDVSSVEEILVKTFGDTPLASRIGGAIDSLNDITPLTATYNLIRAVTSGNSLSQQYKTVRDYTRASNMVYTMWWDDAKKDEYLRRVKAGENPDLLVRELENTWVELAGSVFGDPTTYMGVGLIGKVGKAQTPVRMFGRNIVNLPWEIVGRVPGFTEIFGLKNIGKMGLAGKANEFTDIASPAAEKAFMALGETADDLDAFKKMQGAMDAARKQVREFAGVFDETATLEQKKKVLKGTYGFFASESTAKASLMKKTVGTVMQAMAGRFRNTDDILETFQAYRNLTSDNDEVALRAFQQLKEAYGTVPFSHAGMQAMEFINRLIDDVDIPAMAGKFTKDLPGFADEALKKVNGIIDDMYPSIDDMEKAAGEAKALGVNATERQKFLAKSYGDLQKARPQAIWANKVNRALAGNKAYAGLQSFYAGALMGMRPAYAFRNLLSNSVMIWHDLGARAGVEALVTGVETFGKSIAGRALKQDWTAKVVERETGKIKQILGFLPTQTTTGIGAAEKAGFGFIAVGQDIEKVHSAIITRYVVESEMEKMLRNGGIPNADGIGLPKEMAERLYTHALDTFGDVKETLKRFRNEQATGFAEVWRNLELDPDLKDTLRRANLLDELDDIRKTAADPVEFSQRFDAFVGKIDDLAKRTAEEPAIVSADNPLADVVVTIEKAFDEGGRKVMSEGELNQFRALVELRSQLRNAYQDYADVMRDRIGRLIPPDQMPQFEQRFSQLRQTLEQGNVKWRAYADDLYRGVYAQSRKGKHPSELFGQVRNVMMDFGDDGKPVLKTISMADDFPNVNPAELTTTEFNGMMWKWFKEKQASFWRSYTQSSLMGQDMILDDMAKAAGANIDEIRAAEFTAENNPRLQTIRDLTGQIQDWESHLDFESFGKLDLKGQTLADLNKADIMKQFPNWKGGKSHLFNAVNADRAAQGLEPYATIDDVPFDDALGALKKRGGQVTKQMGDVKTFSRSGGYEDVEKAKLLKTGDKITVDGAKWTVKDIKTKRQTQSIIDDLDPSAPSKGEESFDAVTVNLINESLQTSKLTVGGLDKFNASKKASKIIETAQAAEKIPEVTTPFKPIPPYVEGTQPTMTRQLYENMKGGLREVLDGVKTGTLQRWGEKVPIDSNLTDEAEQALSKWANEMDRRTVSNRAAVASVANATRDFILHDYNKTYADKFAGYFTMYHYWGSRTYAKSLERVVDTPGTMAAYAKWRAAMEKEHSDQPEFYRYNAQIPAGALLGMNKNPLFFNLEATLNPLYSLTGVDFNDPKRRVDWMSSAVDDMGKFGFNTAMPLQWAMAFRLYKKGEDEAARRWLGRLVPATQDLKAGLNLLKEKTGVDLMPDIGILPGAKYGEFDPFINAQGGMDAYEEKRIGRALSAMVMQGELTKEQALDIMYKREGPEFDEAVMRAINERAPGQIASYFMGVGFKQRSEGDMMVEEFYNKYYKLLAQRENISPEDYRQQWSTLRSEYEFADTVLLAARGGDDRDAAYAYNVIGRMPPGDAYDLLAELGVSGDMLNKFYEDKGDFSGWTPQDQNRFMGAMLDLGATFALPDNATRQEWDESRSQYQTQVRDAISAEFGDDVWDVLSNYYDLMDTNKDAAAQFKLEHPEIVGALEMKRELVIANPAVYKYYGSFETIEAYFDGKVRSALAEKYGADITEKQTMYFNLKDESPGQARAFLNQHPELKRYWSEKKKMEAPLNRAMVDFAKDMPEGGSAQLRGDFEAANAAQEQLAISSQQSGVNMEELTSGFSPGLMNQVVAYWTEGTKLSKSGQSSLDYQAKRKGFYDADDLLREIGRGLQGQSAFSNQPSAQPQGFQFAGP